MDTSDGTSDRQSLPPTQVAIGSLNVSPARLDAAIGTLDHWDAAAPKASKLFRDEWREIIARREWPRALDRGDRGQQLRHASPLGKAIDLQKGPAVNRLCKGLSSNT